MNQKKMIATAEHLDRFCKITAVFMKACAIVCAVFAVLVLIFGKAMFDTGSTTLDLDFVKLHLAPEYQAVNPMMQAYVLTGLIAGAVVLFASYRGLEILRLILAPMKSGRPFEENVADNLKKLAWLILIIGAVIQIGGIAARIFITKAFPMEEFFVSSAVVELEYVYTMDFGFVLVFCIVMFLSYVFAYGQRLQQESDETL